MLIKEIAKGMYYQHVTSGFKWEDESQWFRDKYLNYANQILKIIKDNGYGIPDEKAELPKYDFTGTPEFFESGYNIAQQDMLRQRLPRGY